MRQQPADTFTKDRFDGRLTGGGRGTKKGHVIVIWWIGGPFNSEGESGVGTTIL